MKQLAHPGEPEASLGEQGSWKFNEKTLWPLLLVSFAFLIETLNGSLLCTVVGVQHCKSTSKDQKINDDSPRKKLGYDSA